jgi:hypothetical protein
MATKGGQTGNTNARKGTQWRDALERALARSCKTKAKTVDKGLDKIADQVVKNALAGNKDAWQEVANRLDGKHAQAIEISGDEDKPIVTRIERVVLNVDPKD